MDFVFDSQILLSGSPRFRDPCNIFADPCRPALGKLEVSHADHNVAPSSPGSLWFCWLLPPSGAAQQVAAAAGVVAFFFRAETLGFATIYEWLHFNLLTSLTPTTESLWFVSPQSKKSKFGKLEGLSRFYEYHLNCKSRLVDINYTFRGNLVPQFFLWNNLYVVAWKILRVVVGSLAGFWLRAESDVGWENGGWSEEQRASAETRLRDGGDERWCDGGVRGSLSQLMTKECQHEKRNTHEFILY